MNYLNKINISELSILLVEPSKTQLKIITKHLTEEGILNIECATSGGQVLKTLEKYQPDLIISSMYLADMTATELVKVIKSSAKQSEIPFMLISSEVRFSALDPIRQAGVIAILPKPFSHEDLKRALRTTIDYIDPEELSLEHYDVEDVRVLVVDDSLTARKHISRVLNSMGITQITHAADGKEGVDIFRESEDAFDLIVTDFNMPEMDGQQLTETIRNILNNPYIPILMVTSEENEARLSNVQQAGISGICDKPFEPETVKEILCRVLDQQ
ncbi:MAG: response regulator [Methylococcaceae bacterium]|nr:response regulator [Methylococcaceae bacterium]